MNRQHPDDTEQAVSPLRHTELVELGGHGIDLGQDLGEGVGAIAVGAEQGSNNLGQEVFSSVTSAQEFDGRDRQGQGGVGVYLSLGISRGSSTDAGSCSSAHQICQSLLSLLVLRPTPVIDEPFALFCNFRVDTAFELVDQLDCKRSIDEAFSRLNYG